MGVDPEGVRGFRLSENPKVDFFTASNTSYLRHKLWPDPNKFLHVLICKQGRRIAASAVANSALDITWQ
jgi:hypothetical protein